MNEHIELVNKWLTDSASVSFEELKANNAAAEADWHAQFKATGNTIQADPSEASWESIPTGELGDAARLAFHAAIAAEQAYLSEGVVIGEVGVCRTLQARQRNEAYGTVLAYGKERKTQSTDEAA